MKYKFYFVAQVVSSGLRKGNITVLYNLFSYTENISKPFSRKFFKKNPSNSYKNQPTKPTIQNTQEIYTLFLSLSLGWPMNTNENS